MKVCFKRIVVKKGILLKLQDTLGEGNSKPPTKAPVRGRMLRASDGRCADVDGNNNLSLVRAI